MNKKDKNEKVEKIAKAAAQKRDKVKADVKKTVKAVKDKTAEKLRKISEKRDKRKQKSAKPDPNTVYINRLELLVTIVNRNKAEYYSDLIQSFDVNMQTIALAEGTAGVRMRELFGLTNSDRAVIFSVIQENKRKELLPVLEDKFKSIKGGSGIALVVPFANVLGTATFTFLSDNRDAVKENKDKKDV